jgi:hypothetical protein
LAVPRRKPGHEEIKSSAVGRFESAKNAWKIFFLVVFILIVVAIFAAVANR